MTHNKGGEMKMRAYRFSLDTITLIDRLNKKEYTAEVIAKQLLRSATSVGANIVEAQAGSSRKDFTNFLNHALKSANETLYWLCLLRDSQKTRLDDVKTLINEMKEIANMLGASVRTLRRT